MRTNHVIDQNAVCVAVLSVTRAVEKSFRLPLDYRYEIIYTMHRFPARKGCDENAAVKGSLEVSPRKARHAWDFLPLSSMCPAPFGARSFFGRQVFGRMGGERRQKGGGTNKENKT